MYHYQINIPTEEFDAFIRQHPQANLLQSSSWASIKDNWKSERLVIRDQSETIVAAVLILIHPLPLGFTMLYTPRGPIMDYQNQELVSYVLETLKERAKKHKAIFVKFDPSLFLTKTFPDGTVEQDPQTQVALKHLHTAGAKWLGPSEELEETIQPRFHANIYSAFFEESNLPKKSKQTIRTAKNKGIEIQFGGEELLDYFVDLMKQTEIRKQISLRGRNYYQKLLSTYGDDSFITMAFLNLTNRIQKLQTELLQKEKEAASFTDQTRQNKVLQNQKDQERIQSELVFLTQMQEKYGTKVPLAATLTLEYGPTAENIYAGMNNDFGRYQAPILTWLETAKHSFQRGKNWQNLGGIENNLDGGLYNFKKNLSPVIEEFVGEFDLPTSPLYSLASFALKLRKKIRK